jgi:hypothetical protein
MARFAALSIPFLGISLAQAADLPEASVIGDAGPPVAMSEQAPRAGGRTFAVCRNAIAEWAQSYQPVDMDVVSLGPVRRNLDGTRGASLYVRIVYEVQGGLETRKADVECTIDRNDSIAVVPTPRS